MTLEVTQHGAVLTVTLAKPERLNALDNEMFHALRILFEGLHDDESVGVVILTGQGRGFCAGLDLQGFVPDTMTREGPSGGIRQQRILSRMVAAAYDVPVPMIAAVNGPAAGSGFSLALACDLRIAAASASFTTAFITLEVNGAELGMSWMLPRIVGVADATEMILTSRTVDAAEARTMRLVNEVVTDDQLLARAMEIATRIAGFGRLAATMTKQTLRAQLQTSALSVALELEDRTQALMAFGGGVQRTAERYQQRRGPR